MTVAVDAPGRGVLGSVDATESSRGRSALASRNHTIAVLITLLSFSFILGLPHLLSPLLLGPGRPYTPFAVEGVSALTYDETATYAALANYVAVRGDPPYDTDVFENRDLPSPVAVAPYYALAGLTNLLGGLDRAFVVSDFVLPPLAFWVLYRLLRDLTQRRRLALIGAVTTILVPFGPRNFLGVPLQLATGNASDILQPIEYSRLLHPEFSFTLLAVALLLLWLSLTTGRRGIAVAAGVAGGLLFYTYVYYWPAWLGAIVILLAASYRLRGSFSRTAAWWVTITTLFVSLPFWFDLVRHRGSPQFSIYIQRHTSDFGHIPSLEKLGLTTIYIAVFVVLATIYVRSSHYRTPVLLFHSAFFVSSIAAMNMEVVTGFNVEAMLHFPNRLLQPFLTIVAFTFLAPLTDIIRRLPRVSAYATGSTYAVVAVLLGVAMMRQIASSLNVADKHELPREYGLLFGWLNANTAVDDVVISDAKQVNELIPVFTRDRPFVPYGDRTSASASDIERRFLITTKLLQRPPAYVHDLLAQDFDHGDPPNGLTYSYFLFLGGNGVVNWRLPEQHISQLLEAYDRLDLRQELALQRANYVYTEQGNPPAFVEGWSFKSVFEDEYGTLWQLQQQPVVAGN